MSTKIFAIFERTKPNKIIIIIIIIIIIVIKLAAVKFAAISDQVAAIRVRVSSRREILWYGQSYITNTTETEDMTSFLY